MSDSVGCTSCFNGSLLAQLELDTAQKEAYAYTVDKHKAAIITREPGTNRWQWFDADYAANNGIAAYDYIPAH